jgi:hypothetical protein
MLPYAGITQIRFTGRQQNGYPLSLAQPKLPDIYIGDSRT